MPDSSLPPIVVSNISKTFQGFDIDHKDSGVALWVKNVFRLTAEKTRTVRALQDVSFEIKQGQVFGIFGSNGAGKTTLIKILSSLLLPDQGSVCIDGQTKTNHIKDQISYISTNGWMGLEWQLTVYENLALYGNIFGIPRIRRHALCDAALERVGMDHAKDKRISELSAGMRQRVTLARGFLLDRPILYLDEPTVSIDAQFAAALRDMLADYASTENKTLIITSHNPVDLEICDRIMLLHQGRAIALGSMHDLIAPLQGLQVLHLVCAHNHDQHGDTIERVRQELLQTSGVSNIWISTANGRRQTKQVKLMIRQDEHPVGEIVDRFIDHQIPIVGMQIRDVTLDEIYEHYVETNE